MKSTSTVVRKQDGKIFRVACLSHWSDIVADDGETDSVKWYGGNSQHEFYVSANKGFGYKVEIELVSGGCDV